nr:MAG TPA: hypothetical protein [Caudoviricetes sp.]
MGAFFIERNIRVYSLLILLSGTVLTLGATTL